MRLDVEVRFSNPPSISLRTMRSLNELVACNSDAGGYTPKIVIRAFTSFTFSYRLQERCAKRKPLNRQLTTILRKVLF